VGDEPASVEPEPAAAEDGATGDALEPQPPASVAEPPPIVPPEPEPEAAGPAATELPIAATVAGDATVPEPREPALAEAAEPDAPKAPPRQGWWSRFRSR
jgi:hypothetical protein